MTAPWPRLQAAWIAMATFIALFLQLSGALSDRPEWILTLALGMSLWVVRREKWWSAPFQTAAVVGAGALADTLGTSPLIGVGLVAGLLLCSLLKVEPDAFDWVNASLAGIAGAGLALFAVGRDLPLSETATLGVQTAVVALGISAVLPVLAWRPVKDLFPSERQILATLADTYREPVFKARHLLFAARGHSPDAPTGQGLTEVAVWVYRLQISLQTIDSELRQLSPPSVQQRITACRADDEPDPFTRERKQQTVAHLQRLLDHGETLNTERQRTQALSDYATAFLEEARMGLAISKPLPGESAPERLPEVLARLRENASSADARRKTARELEAR